MEAKARLAFWYALTLNTLAPSSSSSTPTCSITATTEDLVWKGGPAVRGLGRLQPLTFTMYLTGILGP